MGTEKIERKRNIEKIDRNQVVVLILFQSYDSHDILGNFASKLYNKDNFFSFFFYSKSIEVISITYLGYNQRNT